MRHVQFLRTLERLRFSGQLILTDAAGQKWIFYLSQGRILYATGGVHPVRRWRRNLAVHCPETSLQQTVWQRDLTGVDATSFALCWEYTLLCLWVAQQKMTRGQAAKVVCSAIVEVLFDITQAGEVTEQIKLDTSLSAQIVLVEVEQAIAAAQRLWQAWQNAMLSQYSPNKALVIRQPEQLQNSKLAQFYSTFVNLLDGRQTLRDLSTRVQRDVLKVASSLLPCVHLGWIGLIDVPDLPAPDYQKIAANQGELIACIDDSLLVHHMMEKLLTSAGYRFLSVDDPIRAIGILLARKPELIFLDLVMPNANGYEICQQLRKLSGFRDTPIVILTGNDGFANRLRSNFVGASDFLSKPLDAEKVLSVIRKHLKQGAIKH